METWVVLVAYDIFDPPAPDEGKPDPHKALRARQQKNRDAIRKWCTDGTYCRYSESAYAVQQLRHLHENVGAVWSDLKRQLAHDLHHEDRIVVQELCGHRSGKVPDCADSLGFRSAPSSSVVVMDALGQNLTP